MNAVKEEELTTCYHCGENCAGSIVLNQHRFCCNGCKTVFEILNENDLCSYYALNNAPGTSRFIKLTLLRLIPSFILKRFSNKKIHELQ